MSVVNKVRLKHYMSICLQLFKVLRNVSIHRCVILSKIFLSLQVSYLYTISNKLKYLHFYQLESTWIHQAFNSLMYLRFLNCSMFQLFAHLYCSDLKYNYTLSHVYISMRLSTCSRN